MVFSCYFPIFPPQKTVLWPGGCRTTWRTPGARRPRRCCGAWGRRSHPPWRVPWTPIIGQFNEENYPLVIKHGNGKTTIYRWFSHLNTIRVFFECNIWLPEGTRGRVSLVIANRPGILSSTSWSQAEIPQHRHLGTNGSWVRSHENCDFMAYDMNDNELHTG